MFGINAVNDIIIYQNNIMIILFCYVYIQIMYKILSLVMMAAMATASPFTERFEQWVKDFRVTVHNDEHKQHLFRNWVENDKFIDKYGYGYGYGYGTT